MRCPGFWIAMGKNCQVSIILRPMANVKSAVTSEWPKNVQTTKNYDIFTTPVSFGHIAAMFRVGFETQ